MNNPSCNIYMDFNGTIYLMSNGKLDYDKKYAVFTINVEEEMFKYYLKFFMYSRCSEVDYLFDWGLNLIKMTGSYGCNDYFQKKSQ